MAKDILIVDDEPDIRDGISGILEDEGYEVRTAATAQQALVEVRTRTPSLVLLDVWLEGSDMDGLELLNYIKSFDPILPVIVISGHGNIETAVAAIRRGAYDFLEKPFKSDRLLVLVERAIEAALLKLENSQLRNQSGLGEIWVGTSSAAALVRSSIDKIAPTNSRILIQGPAGVGKELAARLIHQNSNRSEGQFVVVNAATIAPERMEQVLFGEEDSDGRVVSVGLFERAHSGTLLLDEVADMPPGTQAKILRTLTDQRFQRVRGRSDVKVDVRVISSTTKDMSAEIEAGRFREDLFYRLNVVPLVIPPLTDRRDDIPELIEYFIDRIAQSSGLAHRSFASDAIALLQSMDWPGNVRQLRNMVERVLILSPASASGPITCDELPREGENGGSWQTASASLVGMTLRDARERFEREYLALQITRFGGNISKTAEFIGMERSALHRKLKALGVHSSLMR